MNEPETGHRTTGGYLPALDGLRAVAILLVVFSHATPTLANHIPGTLGVILFFALSGFLITRQLVMEIETSGTCSIGLFYIRRGLRLFPTLFLYILAFGTLLSIMGSHITLAHIASGVFYYANYYNMTVGYPLYNPMPILWSLAVEEHYYLLFPYLLLIFRYDPKKAIPLLAIFVIFALCWRMHVYVHCFSDTLAPLCSAGLKKRFQGTDTIFDCILYGALAFMAMHYYAHPLRRVLVNPYAFVAGAGLLLISLAIRDPFFRATLRYTLQAVGSAIIILNLVFGEEGWIKRQLCSRPVLFIGKISYALYLMHFGVLISLEHNTALYSKGSGAIFHIVLFSGWRLLFSDRKTDDDNTAQG